MSGLPGNLPLLSRSVGSVTLLTCMRRYVEEYPGWVKIDHPQGYWMPVEQHGKAVMHEQDS